MIARDPAGGDALAADFLRRANRRRLSFLSLRMRQN
jgi:hypothetical protein